MDEYLQPELRCVREDSEAAGYKPTAGQFTSCHTESFVVVCKKTNCRGVHLFILVATSVVVVFGMLRDFI